MTPPSPELTVHQRWAQVLADLPAIGKNRTNQQQGFKFRGIDDVLDKVHPLFAKYGVFPVPTGQAATYDERATSKGGVMHVCHITCDWTIYSSLGDYFQAQTLGEGTDAGDKATSKAQTMAFKYLLWPSLAVAENEDPDGITVEASRSVGMQQPSGQADSRSRYPTTPPQPARGPVRPPPTTRRAAPYEAPRAPEPAAEAPEAGPEEWDDADEWGAPVPEQPPLQARAEAIAARTPVRRPDGATDKQINAIKTMAVRVSPDLGTRETLTFYLGEILGLDAIHPEELSREQTQTVFDALKATLGQ
jgi:hypothetical protein